MTRTITPSAKPDLWRGTNTANSEFTVEQIDAVNGNGEIARRIAAFRRYGGMAQYVVRKLTEPRSLQDIPREVRFTCPVVAMRKDRTAVCVVAPNGMTTWTALK